MQIYIAVRINIKATVFQTILILYLKKYVSDICRKYCHFYPNQLYWDADIRL